MEAIKITENEWLEQSHLPVSVIINSISDNDFLKVVQNICEAHSWGGNFGAVNFWNDLDEYDKTFYSEQFEGAEFSLFSGETAIISYCELYYYIELACKKYCESFPCDEKELKKALTKFYNKHCLNN